MQETPAADDGQGCGWRGWGCGLVVLGIVSGIFYFVFFSNLFARMAGQETYAFKADVSHLDPFAALAEIREHAGPRAHLISIDAEGVRADGTMDLNAAYKPGPKVTYTFLTPVEKPPGDAPPVGAGRAPGDVWLEKLEVECYQPGYRKQVSKTMGGSKTSYSYTNDGMDFDRHAPEMGKLLDDIGTPKMATVEVWKAALEKGAPKDAVAAITFQRDGYRFYIRGTRVHFEFDSAGKAR